MKTFKVFAAIVLSASLLVSCRSEYDLLLQSNDAEAKYKAAFDYFNAGKYTRAAELFESIAVLTSGTARDDTVQYYWALSNYSAEDFATAETNFSNFIENFPRSPFKESATFLHVDCLYRSTLRYELDQTPTYTAITAIGQYLLDNSDSANAPACRRMLQELNDRIDKKTYENAKLYYAMEDYMAARVALKNVLKDDSDNIYREDILYYSAMASYKYAEMSVASKQRERFITFEDDYLNFIGEYPESNYRRELDRLYAKVKGK